jgi:hypothetical protein
MKHQERKKARIFALKSTGQEGQTLVIVIVLMIIALSIGIAISSKYIRGLKNISQTDQSSKSIGIAEGAIENILILPIATIEDYAANGTCGAACHMEITDANGQLLTADVDLSILGNTSEPFLVELKKDQTTQVNLTGYPSGQDLTVCWNQEDMSVSGLYLYGTVGDYQADAYAYNPTTTTHGDNNFDLANPLFGYSNCFVIAALDNSAMLRLKAYYQEGVALVIPASGAALPTQGILIESTGKAGTTEKTVSVIITDPILPSQFDYSLMQKDPSQPLSN